MNVNMYNSLLPHKELIDAAFVCIDKHTELPSFPRFLINTMIAYWDELSGKSPTDKSCGACVTEAVKEVVKRFKMYEDSIGK